ncbi:universal stress protein [Desulfococcaceae bacterium HSG7]|nr:universal stress protein [Desulfococcaceae bacterium HSG7]
MTLKIKKILCATDFTAFSQEALRFGVSLARQFDALLLVFHAVYSPHDPVYGSTEFERGGERDKTVADAKIKIKSMMAPFQIRWAEAVSIGEPVEQFLKVAEQQDTDLIITASHGLSGFKRLFLGTVVERLCRALTRPLLVVRPRPYALSESEINKHGTPDQKKIQNIAVACADNNLSAKIIRHAADLALAFNARLHLVHAIEAPIDADLVEPTNAPYTQVQEQLQNQLRQRLEERIPQQLRPQCDFMIALRPGIPQEILPVYAAEHNADLIIVGAWRQSKMENLLIGSTTKAMLRHAACDVLVLPFTETNAGEKPDV